MLSLGEHVTDQGFFESDNVNYGIYLILSSITPLQNTDPMSDGPTVIARE